MNGFRASYWLVAPAFVCLAILSWSFQPLPDAHAASPHKASPHHNSVIIAFPASIPTATAQKSPPAHARRPMFPLLVALQQPYILLLLAVAAGLVGLGVFLARRFLHVRHLPDLPAALGPAFDDPDPSSMTTHLPFLQPGDHENFL